MAVYVELDMPELLRLTGINIKVTISVMYIVDAPLTHILSSGIVSSRHIIHIYYTLSM